jgi:hypothetical protein
MSDPSPSPLPARAAIIVGALGVAASSIAPALPEVWAPVVAIVGFLAAALAGLGVAPPKIAEGRPILQGAAFSTAVAVGAAVQQIYPSIPMGWPQSMAAGAVALVAFLTGAAMPHLGATANTGGQP